MSSKQKGYRVERKIRILFQKHGWTVVRAGASLGIADLICIKNKQCILLQIKATNKKTLYYYEYMKPGYEGFDFYLVVDFGYGKIRMLHPTHKITINDGDGIADFLQKHQ